MRDEDIKKIRATLKEELEPIKQRLDDPERGLDSINGKLDTLTGEMNEVNKKSKATYELVKHFGEKHEQEIKRLKRFVGLPDSQS